MYKCEACGGSFARFKTPGQCPLCQIWAFVQCNGCGYRAHANHFIDNGDVCPKCGMHVASPGQPARDETLDKVPTRNLSHTCKHELLDVLYRLVEKATGRRLKKGELVQIEGLQDVVDTLDEDWDTSLTLAGQQVRKGSMLFGTAVLSDKYDTAAVFNLVPRPRPARIAGKDAGACARGDGPIHQGSSGARHGRDRGSPGVAAPPQVKSLA